jgi:membrane associated rhomboid family serine protease
MSYSNSTYRFKSEAFDADNAVLRLVVICLALFAAFGVMWGVWLFSYPKEIVWVSYSQDILRWFVLSASTEELLYKPWTVLTYSYADYNFLSVFPNLFWLWCFGYIMQDIGGNKRIIPLFIYGGIGGALFFVLANILFSSVYNTTLVGAGPAVMAVVVATTILSPDYRLFPLIGGGLPLWVLTVIYIAANFLLLGLSNTGAIAAHLGGAVAGAIFISFFKNGIDMGKWINNFLDWVNNLFNPNRPKKGRDIKNELFYKANVKPYSKLENPTEERIDTILDKINHSGYSSLSDAEKELLERAAGKEY